MIYNVVRKLLSLCIVFTFVYLAFSSNVKAQENNTIYFFYGSGCPHCVNVEEYFEKSKIPDSYPIVYKEIYFNRENSNLYNMILDSLDYPVDKRGVPLVVMGETVLVGDKVIIERFTAEADQYISKGFDTNKTSSVETTLNVTLPLVVGASIVDAINPCAFAVLIILMSTIVLSGNSKKALYSGICFSTAIFISYFLMGLGLYTALSTSTFSSWFYSTIGLFAILLGLLNIKDYFWYGKGFLMEVPLRWRPTLKKLISSVTNPIGAFGVGFLVSLFLLPCTSGPYIVILGMLSQKMLVAQAILYLLIYNLIFVLPMFIITFLVYKGLDPQKAENIRQKRLKTLHLIAGVIMLVMGIIILSGWV